MKSASSNEGNYILRRLMHLDRCIRKWLGGVPHLARVKTEVEPSYKYCATGSLLRATPLWGGMPVILNIVTAHNSTADSGLYCVTANPFYTRFLRCGLCMQDEQVRMVSRVT